MITAKIEERKHRLIDVLVRQGASPTTVSLFEQLVNKIDTRLRAQGKPVFFRTHKFGVTGFINERKAFIGIDLLPNHVSTLYWTGRCTIPGLKKANWLQGGDNQGSKRVLITDTATVAKAVEFACAAYDIAVSAYGSSK